MAKSALEEAKEQYRKLSSRGLSGVVQGLAGGLTGSRITPSFAPAIQQAFSGRIQTPVPQFINKQATNLGGAARQIGGAFVQAPVLAATKGRVNIPIMRESELVRASGGTQGNFGQRLSKALPVAYTDVARPLANTATAVMAPGRLALGASIGVAGQGRANISQRRPVFENASRGAGSRIENAWILALTGSVTDKLLGGVGLGKFTDKSLSGAWKVARNSGSYKQLATMTAKQMMKGILETPVETAAFSGLDIIKGDKNIRAVFERNLISNLIGNVAFHALGSGLNASPVIMRDIGKALKQTIEQTMNNTQGGFTRISGKMTPDVPAPKGMSIEELADKARGTKPGEAHARDFAHFQARKSLESEMLSYPTKKEFLDVVIAKGGEVARKADIARKAGFKGLDDMYEYVRSKPGTGEFPTSTKVPQGSLYDIASTEQRIKSKGIVNPDINKATDAGFITKDGNFVSVDTGHSKALGDLGMGEKKLNDYLDAGGIRTYISRESGDINVQINKTPTPQQLKVLQSLPEDRRYFFDIKAAHPNYTKVGTSKADFIKALNKNFPQVSLGKQLSKFANEEVDINKLNEKYTGKALGLGTRQQALQRGVRKEVQDLSKTRPGEAGGINFGAKIEPLQEKINSTKNIPPPPDIPAKDSKYAFNINKKRLNISNAARVRLDKTVSAIKPELELAKGKRLSNAEVVKAAKISDSLKNVVSRKETADITARLTRLRQEVAAGAEGKGVSKDYIQNLKVLSSWAADTGRKLQSFSIGADPDAKSVKEEIVRDIIKLGKDTDEIISASKNVDFTNPKEATAFYRQYVKASTSELLDEYRYINLLSSPKTHIINTFSNILQAGVVSPGTKLYSGAVDAFAEGLTGKARTHYVGEVPQYYKGAFNAIPDAIDGFRKALSGESFMGRPDIKRLGTGNKLLEQAGIILRFLEAQDVFFRTMIKGGELESLSYKAGKTGKQLDPSALDAKAGENAAYYVFRGSQEGQGKLLESIDTFTKGIYSLRKGPLKWFIPFVQTTMNIVKQGIEYSPVGVATIPGAKDPIEQIGKALMGSTVMLGAAYLAARGDSTWAAPTGEKDKEVFYASGRKPYSIRIGDRWYGYSRLGPLAYPIAMATALKYNFEQDPKAAEQTNFEKIADTVGGVAKFFTDQSYLQGVGSFINATRGDKQALKSALSNIPRQLIPLSSLQGWVARIIDPVYRKAGSPVESQ